MAISNKDIYKLPLYIETDTHRRTSNEAESRSKDILNLNQNTNDINTYTFSQTNMRQILETHTSRDILKRSLDNTHNGDTWQNNDSSSIPETLNTRNVSIP